MTSDNEQSRQKIRVRVPARRKDGADVRSAAAEETPADASSLDLNPSPRTPPSRTGEKVSLTRSVGHKPGGDAPPQHAITPSVPRSSSARPPHETSEDRARRLTFELEIGELPNVLQFISTDKRTGILELTVQNQPNAGCVFFKGGEVYLAKYHHYEGVEALARVVNTGRVRAVFTNDVTTREKNISMPVSSLLLEVLVRADELAAESPETTTPAASSRQRGFSMHPKGTRPTSSPVGNIDRDTPPRPVSVPPRGGGVQVVRETASRVPPTTRDSAVLSRLAVRAVKLVILAGLLGGLYLAYERFDQLRNASPGQPSAGQPDWLAGDDMDSVTTLLAAAEKAVRARNYDEADMRIERALTLDPGNAQALLLREVVDRENAPAMAAKLVGIAKKKTVEAALLSEWDWASPDVEKVERAYEAGNRFLADKNFELAVRHYRESIAGADTLFKQRRNYLIAMEKQGQAAAMKAKASQAGGMDYASGLWAAGAAAEREAENHVAMNAFKAAAAAWEKASDCYQRGAAYSLAAAEVERLSAEFKALRAACEGVALSEQGASLAKQAEVLAAAAEAAARQGDWELATMKWRQALGAQGNLSSIVEDEGHRRRYEDLIAKARSLAETSDWHLARGAYAAALAVPGYENDATAVKGVAQADKELLIQTMTTAADEGRWQDAKAVAEELLAADPANPAAADMMSQVKARLVVRLTIQAVYNGLPVAGARAVIGGEPDIRILPYTVDLPVARNHHIRVWAPPRGTTYFETYTTVYEGVDFGPDTLTVRMEAMGPPEKTKAWRLPGMDLDMAYIRSGTFAMGSETRRDEQPVRQVVITRSFWMGITEVTNRQYREFLAGTGYDGKKSANSGYLRHFNGSSAMPDGDMYPICYVSWKNAMAFCEWLTNREREGNRLTAGYVYRLPTEAEWEYCARLDNRSGRADLDGRAWYARNAKANQPVRQLRANGAGLNDMLGNVWEFCYDYYGPYNADEVADPVAPPRGVLRVMRGGSHVNPAELCRPGYRSGVGWMDARPNVGFRIVLAPRIEELRKSTPPDPAVRSSSGE
ncbi:MAG: SUMF1/EgtB/PvdO family nonheme iron enzyme [Lentisphaeria bacterium]|nr:SUMF1/EgtB/PvdO family nonheme iron enzyme [Lentisphaeria bacterium]